MFHIFFQIFGPSPLRPLKHGPKASLVPARCEFQWGERWGGLAAWGQHGIWLGPSPIKIERQGI